MNIKFTNTHNKLVVITTETKWDETPRMRHHVALQLSSSYNILFVEIDSCGKGEIRRISDNIFVWKIGGYIRGTNKFRILKYISHFRQSILIKSKINNLKIDSKIVINFKFDFYQVYKYINWSLKYFFLNDDFINMPNITNSKQRKHRYIDQSKTINNCNRVFVSADALANQIENKNIPHTIVYSGHDFDAKYNFKKNITLKRTLIFMGFINNNLELDWIEELAKTNKYELIFIGPVEHQTIKDHLSNYNNIRFENALTGNNLYSFLCNADVFIMPYKSIEVNTISSVPAKLFQYLACGRPVVSNFLPNLISLPNYFVYQAKSSKDFLNLIELSIEEDSESKNRERIDFANDNKWDKRGQLLKSVLESDFNDI